MPEGDTIHYAAKRVGAALTGREIRAIETPHPRTRGERWSQKLDGRGVRAVDAHGKHLFIRFDGDLTLHSHLRMTGKWGVYRHGERWRRARRRAWLVIRTEEHEVVQFDGPVLQLTTDSRTRFDPHLAGLGPDVLAPEFDQDKFLSRIREDDQTRGLGEALLDQRNLAGIGNIWKAESCFMAGLDPWKPTAEVDDGRLLGLVENIRPLMAKSAERGGHITTFEGDRRGATWVYGRDGLPCRRCGTIVRARGQGDDNRTTFWCPGCQQ